jgi:predicted nuclease of predicted toxin-antitoxin system
MRVLIDECVDPRVKLLLGDHKVATVHERGWDTLEDGPLLTVAQRDFDVLVTIDGGLEFQQNLARFQIGVIVVHVPKNQLAHYRVIQKELLAAIEKARAGEVIHVRTPSV